MKRVDEYDILRAITEVSAAMGAMDTVCDFIDSKPRAVLMKYRGWLGNTVEEMIKWITDGEDADDIV